MRSSTSLSCRMPSPATVSRSTGAIPDTSKNCASFSASWNASDSLRCSSALGYSRSDLPYVFEHLRHATVDIIGCLDETLQCRARAGCVRWTQRMNVGGPAASDAKQQDDQASGSQPLHTATERFSCRRHGRSPRSLLGIVDGTPSGFAHSSELARVKGGWQQRQARRDTRACRQDDARGTTGAETSERHCVGRVLRSSQVILRPDQRAVRSHAHELLVVPLIAERLKLRSEARPNQLVALA